jgi:hypothetical protein
LLLSLLPVRLSLRLSRFSSWKANSDDIMHYRRRMSPTEHQSYAKHQES